MIFTVFTSTGGTVAIKADEVSLVVTANGSQLDFTKTNPAKTVAVFINPVGYHTQAAIPGKMKFGGGLAQE